ncbi:hypothetical protein [Lachnotalea glycerini]|uniref:Uncharacterized protein n=1 Tax=Lachnotalea glycerini TaxID=1763509 RepID=A0A371JA01_9FIRM|nr:hypothetical protein [Lachnotalea glycerini]RDY29589.1 hypothetical protein CG710_018135 [Lachnotalea glycerini]
MKKFISFFLTVIMISLPVIPSMATTTTTTLSRNKKNSIEKIITNTPYEQREYSLKNLLNSTNKTANITSSLKSNTSNVNEEDITYIEAQVDEVVDIDEDTSIVFFASGDFLVYDTVNTVDVPVMSNMCAANSINANKKASSNTSTVKSVASAYNVLGYVVLEVWAEGYFSYNGSSTPTPYMVDYDYAKYGVLNAWNVDNWKGSTSTNDSNKTAQFKASGTFGWGLTWQDNHWNMQTYTITVGYKCTKAGKTQSIKSGI